MTWELLFENWYKIIALVILLASVVISPFVIIRKIKTKNELEEMQTFIKKNTVVQEEIARLSEEMRHMDKRIRDLEGELHDEKTSNRRLTEENETLKRKLAECNNRK